MQEIVKLTLRKARHAGGGGKAERNYFDFY
jgi:hypothetical protein